MAETSPGPDEPDEPDEPDPEEPDPDGGFAEPEPFELAEDEEGTEFELVVQATWPRPTPAARAMTAAAPIMAA
jgi:hypothetical protein